MNYSSFGYLSRCHELNFEHTRQIRIDFDYWHAKKRSFSAWLDLLIQYLPFLRILYRSLSFSLDSHKEYQLKFQRRSTTRHGCCDVARLAQSGAATITAAVTSGLKTWPLVFALRSIRSRRVQLHQASQFALMVTNFTPVIIHDIYKTHSGPIWFLTTIGMYGQV